MRNVNKIIEEAQMKQIQKENQEGRLVWEDSFSKPQRKKRTYVTQKLIDRIEGVLETAWLEIIAEIEKNEGMNFDGPPETWSEREKKVFDMADAIHQKTRDAALVVLDDLV